jgi:hypothetical protein
MAATEQEMVQAFQAIDEEASSLMKDDLPDEMKEGLTRIMKIARHKKDTRKSAPGSCTSDRAG